MSQGHAGFKYPRCSIGWMATARLVEDLGKEVGDEAFNGEMGIIFGDGAFIEIRTTIGGGAKPGIIFGCTTGREEIETDILFNAIDFLWYTHSMHEWPYV